MSTAATSTLQNIKSRLPTSNSIHTIPTNGSEGKLNGIYGKRPKSATNFLPNYPTSNDFNYHLKQCTNCSTKPLTIDNKKQQNGHSSKTKIQPPSPPIIFHAIAPAPIPAVLEDSLKQDTHEQKVFVFFYFYSISS